MDRQLSLGNRLIANYMQQKQKKRLKQKLKCIKQNRSLYSSVGQIKQKPKVNSFFFQKNQQIQKQNIVIFKRIASIIKKQPKIQCENTPSIQKSRQTSMLWNRKIQSSLQEQNKIIQKRLLSQKPTINNKIFYQQRSKHMKYLKYIGKYPYILDKKIKTQTDINAFDEVHINNTQLPSIFNANNQQQGIKQLFKHQSLDFTININVDLRTDICTFNIQNNQTDEQMYSLSIPKSQFIEYFQESDYDYEKMIGNLRLNDQGNVVYAKQQSNKMNETPKQQKQGFKFKAQSTAYTSTGFKSGFRSNKRNLVSKNQNQEIRTSKTDRKLKIYQVQQKLQKRKQTEALSQNKFAQISLVTKQKLPNFNN